MQKILLIGISSIISPIALCVMQREDIIVETVQVEENLDTFIFSESNLVTEFLRSSFEEVDIIPEITQIGVGGASFDASVFQYSLSNRQVFIPP